MEFKTDMRCGRKHGDGHVKEICWAYICKNVLNNIVFAIANVVEGSERIWKGNQCLYSQICFEMGLFYFIWGGGLCREKAQFTVVQNML